MHLVARAAHRRARGVVEPDRKPLATYRAQEIRIRVQGVIGDSLSGIVSGSDQAIPVKAVLQAKGLWPQYLEVGIGPDAEVFTKAGVTASRLPCPGR